MRLLLIPFDIIITHSSDLSAIKYDFFTMMYSFIRLLSFTFVIVDFKLNWMFLLNHCVESLSEIVGFVHWPTTAYAFFGLIMTSVRLVHSHVLDIVRSHQMLPLAAAIKSTSIPILSSSCQGTLDQFTYESIPSVFKLLRTFVNC